MKFYGSRLTDSSGKYSFFPALPCAREFLSRGADPNASGPSKKSLLQCALISGYEEKAELLISYGAKIEPNLLWSTVGSRKRHGERMTRFLLEKGVDPNQALSEEWGRPLHLAAAVADVKLVELLLGAGAERGAVSTGWRVEGMTAEEVVVERISWCEDAENEEWKAVLRLLRS